MARQAQTLPDLGGAGNVSRPQMQKLHEATLQVLERTGMRVDCLELHGPLEAAGAWVDHSSNVVKFPARLIEETIEFLRKQVASGRCQYLLNGVTNPRWTPPLGCKFGGACVEYLPPGGEVRTPTSADLIRLLQLGEALPDVGFVGNPVACIMDDSGKRVVPEMQRVVTTALVAKYTTKCGSTEVWNEKELEFLIEIGAIARGGEEQYQVKPCFVTAKETIAPLRFPAEDGRILLMLARRGLPCTIVPMPLTGATCPCSVASNIVMANAEILGAMTCIHASAPDAMVGGGVISGTMDMTTGMASFSAPEALLQDAGLACLYDNYYGQDLAIGTGYIDAKYPGAQSMAEKTLKMQAAAQQGRFNFPVGLLVGGKRFSPVEAVMELESAEAIKRLTTKLDVSDEMLALDVIAETGIGGEFLSHPHTLEHFRDNLWRPELLDRTAPQAKDAEKDMVARAEEKVNAIWDRNDLYCIDESRSRAIDDVVASARKALLNT